MDEEKAIPIGTEEPAITETNAASNTVGTAVLTVQPVTDGETLPVANEEAPTEEPLDTAQAIPPEESESLTESGGQFRYIIRTAMILLGLFAAIIYAICAIDGVGALLETGLGKLALGEIYSGVDNVSVMSALPHTSLGTILSPEKTLDLSVLPANEHEDAADDLNSDEAIQNTEQSPKTQPTGGIPIVTADLSAKAEDGFDLINETPYEVSLSADTERSIPPLSELYAAFGSDAPIVLILHTHTTESYADDGSVYTLQDNFRSEDPAENMLAVGQTLADTLTERGINAILCEEQFDAADFNTAYYKASLKIRQYLEEYPSISYIFDLHRDSIPYGDGTIRPVTEIDGKPCAQAMFVVGTDYGGSNHTEWGDNFNLACRVQADVFAAHSTLMRAINLRSASFNEQYTHGSLLIEIGAVGSSLAEACNTASVLGEFLADEIIGK